MEISNSSRKLKLKRLKIQAQKTGKHMERRTGYQFCIQHLVRLNPLREKRERALRRKSISPDILMIEGVAEFLGCSVQRVRSISDVDLSRRKGPGKCDLFFREDVIAFVRANPKRTPASDELIRDVENVLLESKLDSGSRRCKRRNSDD